MNRTNEITIVFSKKSSTSKLILLEEDYKNSVRIAIAFFLGGKNDSCLRKGTSKMIRSKMLKVKDVKRHSNFDERIKKIIKPFCYE